MVIGHVFKAAGKIVNKTVPKGSRIQVDKAVKTAQGIAGSRPVKQISVYEREELNKILSSKADRLRRGRPLKGTGPRGGNTRNDKVIDKKLKEKKVKISKVIKSDKKRILVGKLPVVKRKGHYKRQSKNTSLVAKGSGVKATELKRSKQLEKADMTFRLEELAEDTGLVPRSRVVNNFFRGNKKGSSPFEIWQNKKESAPKGSHHQTGNRGTTFWKKTADGRSTFRNPMERGEQTIKTENALKWTGVGVGLGGAATLGGLGSEPSRAERNAERYLKKSKDERWGYW